MDEDFVYQHTLYSPSSRLPPRHPLRRFDGWGALATALGDELLLQLCPVVKPRAVRADVHARSTE